MRPIAPLAVLLPVLLLAACRDEAALTAPASVDDLAAFHTPGHKVVNSLADPGDGSCNAVECTLREAIDDPTSRRITFAPGVRGTITLRGRLTIDHSLRIVGPKAGITLQRRSTDPDFRILRITTTDDVALTNLTIRGAKSVGLSGAILSDARLTLTNCRISENATAGINSVGPLTLANTVVANNVGDGIATKEDLVTMTNSTVSGNTGLGFSGGGTITIDNSTFSDDGIRLESAIFTMRNTVIRRGGLGLSWTTAVLDHVGMVGGGIGMWQSELTMDHGTVASSGGTGIYNGVGRVTITNSAIVNNGGDGIRNDSFGRAGIRADIVNTTISGNTGEGIYTEDDVEAGASVDIVSSTIVLNGSYGIHQVGNNGGSVGMTNTIVALNGGPGAPDLFNSGHEFGLFASFSLIGNGTGSGLEHGDGNLVGNVGPNTSSIDPKIIPLADNGGPTPTHALRAGSPARNAGGAEFCPATDQRGVARPQGPACDMGSYERN
jgi:CSLREA domain-containing protein